MNSICYNIRKIRTEKSVTQNQLAEKLQVTHQTVSNWETGKSAPSVDLLPDIAKALDVDINTVLYGRPKETEKKDKKRILLFVFSLLFYAGYQLFLYYFTSKYGKYAVNDSRLYSLVWTVLMAVCIPSIYILPVATVTEYLSKKYVTDYSFISKNSSAVRKVLWTLRAYYVLCFLYFYAGSYIFNGNILPEPVRMIWQQSFMFFTDGRVHLILWAVIYGLTFEPGKDIGILLLSDSPKNTIAKNLKAIRTEQKLTQSRMAQKLFVTQQTVSNWEQGKAMPDLPMLMEISRKLNVDIYRLLYNPPAKSPKGKIKLAARLTAILCLTVILLFFDNMSYINIYWLRYKGLTDMVEKAVVKPLILFLLPVAVLQLLENSGGFKYRFYTKYSLIVKVSVVLIMILFRLICVPEFIEELADVIKTSQPLLYIQLKESLLPRSITKYTTMITVFISRKMPWIFSVLGALYKITAPKTRYKL